MTAFSCIFCKENQCSFHTSAKLGPWEYVACSHCKTVQLFPLPTGNDLELAYSDEYYGLGKKKFIPFVERLVQWFRGQRARTVGNLLPKNGRILDIGCGNGEFLGELMDAHDCYGIELPGKQADRARGVLGDHLKIGTLENSDYPNNSFEAITLWHVYEHLLDPSRTLEIVGRILKPSGHLYISMPNIDSWQAEIFKGFWFHLDSPRHIFFHTPEQLTCELKSKGFMLQDSQHLSFEQNLYGYLQSFLNVIFRPLNYYYHCLQGGKQEKGRFLFLIQTAVLISVAPFFLGLTILEAGFRKGGTVTMHFKKGDEKQ